MEYYAMDDKKILFSAVQPSGILTLGNYLGAIKNWKMLQEDYNCIYSLADLHTLTVRQVPADLRANTYQLTALYLACGIDPEKSVLFLQSHVSAHAELAWILNTITYPGELSRMTQFKDKSQKHEDNINMGLMDYPVLMAADILLYGTELVPVGADQKQHLELARDLAIRFNSRYSDTFKVPEGYISKVGARIMSLQEPTKKMSKSDANLNAFISMDDDKDTIIRKFKRAVTDSDNKIVASPDKPGISNLLSIYSAVTGKSIADCENEFDGLGYGDFKLRVGEAVAELVEPIRQEKNKILTDKAYIDNVLANGAEKAERIAGKMLSKVYKKVGLVQKVRR
jgi:tryptophanyl-tRNA synthetase